MNYIKHQHNYYAAKLQAKNAVNSLQDIFLRYKERANAIPEVVKKNDVLLNEIITSFDAFDDMILYLEDRLTKEKREAYQNGYKAGKEESTISMRKPSRWDKDEYRRYTIAKALQISEQIEINTHGISQYYTY